MLKIVGGDWPQGRHAAVRGSFSGAVTGLWLQKTTFSGEEIGIAEVASADIVTQANEASIAGKLGWGGAGGLLLGPVGLLAGLLAGGNRNMSLMAVTFADGRKVLLAGKSKELQPLLGACFGRSAEE